MLTYFYMNQGVDVERLKETAIKHILAINSYERGCNDEASFQMATQALINAYTYMHNALVEDPDDEICLEPSNISNLIWKNYSVKGYLKRIHGAGYAHVTAEDVYECVDYPETVDWSKIRAPECLLKTAALTYGEYCGAHSLEMQKLHAKVQKAKEAGTLDTSNSQEMIDFFRNNV